MNENPGIDFKSVFGDGEGFTTTREMTPEEQASAKPCPGDSVYKHPSVCECIGDAGTDSEGQEEMQRRFIESGLAAKIDESIQNSEGWVTMKRPDRNRFDDADQDRLVPPEDFIAEGQRSSLPDDCTYEVADDFGGLTNEEFEAALRKASEMSERALERAEEALLRAMESNSNETAGRFMAVHDRWLHFAQIVAP